MAFVGMDIHGAIDKAMADFNEKDRQRRPRRCKRGPLWTAEQERRERAARANFTVDDRFFLVYCPECGKENYALAVGSGTCCWCGYDGNKEKN